MRGEREREKRRNVKRKSKQQEWRWILFKGDNHRTSNDTISAQTHHLISNISVHTWVCIYVHGSNSEKAEILVKNWIGGDPTRYPNSPSWIILVPQRSSHRYLSEIIVFHQWVMSRNFQNMLTRLVEKLKK